MKLMPAVLTDPIVRRETGDDHICVLTFDRPDSGANIFDDATLDELNEHLDDVENDTSIRGLIITSAKKSIFVAGADLKTLLQAGKTGEMGGFIERGQQAVVGSGLLPQFKRVRAVIGRAGIEVLERAALAIRFTQALRDASVHRQVGRTDMDRAVEVALDWQ